MTPLKRCRFFVFVFLASWHSVLNAQITWSGIYDFGIRKGGRESKPELNELPNEHVQLNVQNVQFFLEGVIDDGISFSSKVSTGKRSGFELRGLELELAFVTFSNLMGEALSVSAGKILTPFGVFARRQLSPDNPFIGNPLFFHYQTNVSPVSGYLDSTGVLLAQSLYGGRLSTIYNGGYYVGAEAFGSFGGGLIQYDCAVMNAPLASSNSGANLDKQLSFHGRVAVHPFIWGTFGGSFCSGSFLERGAVNTFLDSLGGTERFKQQTIGMDFNLAYLFYELSAEYIINRMNAPYIVYDFTIIPPYKSGLVGKEELFLSSRELLIDLKVEAPFYPGVFLAARYDNLSFSTIDDPFASSTTYGKRVPWDHEVQRYAVGLGYKPARGVLVKAGYEWTILDTTPRPGLDVAGIQMSIIF